jgi:3-methyl-2-oxobutanoate hydroxymethyltransferase
MKERGRRLVALTAYDYPTAQLLDQAGVDLLLVGDSVGDNVLGLANTLPVTLEMMLHHTAAVSRGAKRALVVADMPFLTYQVDPSAALENAGRLVREAGAEAVKVEGAGRRVVEAIEALVEVGIPVLGHVGYTPQSTHAFGASRVRGKDADTARLVLDAAHRLESAGCSAVVLECTPAPLSRQITEELVVPTIGIGAGPHCDGQVLIVHDVLNLGVAGTFRPRFAKQYADLAATIHEAVSCYANEVRQGVFPGPEHAFDMPREELRRLTEEATGS